MVLSHGLLPIDGMGIDASKLPITPRNNGLSLEEIGSSGLKQYAGYVREEFQKNLQGPKAALVYREMWWNDPMVAASVRAIDLIMRQVPWSVESDANDTEPDKQDKAAATFVDECRNDTDRPWVEVISDIVSMIIYGWQWSEIVWKKRDGMKPGNGASGTLSGSKYADGKWGWAKIAGRAQESLHRWQFDESGNVVGMWQLRPDNWTVVFIPAWKSLHFRTSSYRNNPEGHSLLRSAYWPWYFKKHIEEIRAIGIERDLAGLPVAYLDVSYFQPNLPPDKQAVFVYMQKLVANIKRDEQEGVLMPLAFDQNNNKLVDLELLTTGGRRQMDIDRTIEYYDQKITESMFTDFLLLGHERIGTQALSTSKTDVFSTIIGALLDHICEIFNNVAIPQLLAVNGFKVDHMPKLAHGDINIRDTNAIATMLLNLSQAGAPIFGHEAGLRLLNEVLEAAELPSIPEDSWDEILQPEVEEPEPETPTAGQPEDQPGEPNSRPVGAARTRERPRGRGGAQPPANSG